MLTTPSGCCEYTGMALKAVSGLAPALPAGAAHKADFTASAPWITGYWLGPTVLAAWGSALVEQGRGELLCAKGLQVVESLTDANEVHR